MSCPAHARIARLALAESRQNTSFKKGGVHRYELLTVRRGRIVLKVGPW